MDVMPELRVVKEVRSCCDGSWLDPNGNYIAKYQIALQELTEGEDEDEDEDEKVIRLVHYEDDVLKEEAVFFDALIFADIVNKAVEANMIEL